MDVFKVVRWLPHILKDTDVKKKLKRKHKTYAKNAKRSVVKPNENGSVFDIVLKTMKLISYCLSAYRSVRDLGWFEYLPTFWEKLGVVIKFILLIIKKYF